MLEYGFMQNALIISFFIAILCPCIGIFLVLRRESMIGDTLSHASLAGITIGLLCGQSPIIGAFIFSSLAGGLIEVLRERFKKYADLVLTIVLSLSVGTAITIISSGWLHTNAESFLFGSVLTVEPTDLYTVIGLSVFALLAILLLYNQLLYLAYDDEMAKVVGVKVKLINYIFSVLVAAAISVSIRIVGVLVLSSMIALPVATALQLGKGFRKTLVFSICFSVVDILLGLFLSYYANVAPGGFTALISVGVFLIVLIARNIVHKIRIKALQG